MGPAGRFSRPLHLPAYPGKNFLHLFDAPRPNRSSFQKLVCTYQHITPHSDVMVTLTTHKNFDMMPNRPPPLGTAATHGDRHTNVRSRHGWQLEMHPSSSASEAAQSRAAKSAHSKRQATTFAWPRADCKTGQHGPLGAGVRALLAAAARILCDGVKDRSRLLLIAQTPVVQVAVVGQQ